MVGGGNRPGSERMLKKKNSQHIKVIIMHSKEQKNPKLFPESCRENNFFNESNEDETLPAGQLVIFPPHSTSPYLH